MAVYKPTLCYPFLNGVDARVAIHNDASITPYQYLSCQIDTSNKNITGYKIRILTEDNQQIFPVNEAGEPIEGQISPIRELQSTLLGYELNGVNSGINGTTLRIPFFQNINKKLLNSFNCVYYNAQFLADYLIIDRPVEPFFPSYFRTPTPYERASNWDFDGDDKLVFNWDRAISEYGSEIDESDRVANRITLDGDVLSSGKIILIIGSTAVGVSGSKTGLWRVVGEEIGGTLTTTLTRLNASTGYEDIQYGANVTIVKGQSFHNTVWHYTNSFSYKNNDAIWKDINGNDIPLSADDATFKWEVTLYQGNYTELVQSPATSINYDDLDPEWLDMTLMSGTVLGSTPERIQIGLQSDPNTIDYMTMKIPRGTEANPLVLQGKYIQLLDVNSNPINKRVYIKNYDSTLGHVYPLVDTTAISKTAVDQSVYCEFYKLSNNPDDILSTDMIDYCFSDPLTIWYCKYEEGILFNPYPNENDWKNEVSLNNRKLIVPEDIGLPEGTRLLLIGQAESKQNGVYTLYSMMATKTGESTESRQYYIERSGSYTQWSEYIQKVFYCINADNYTKYAGKNVECLAKAGTYKLWNPLVADSGDSSLIFVPERPMLLDYERVASDQYTVVNNRELTSQKIESLNSVYEFSGTHDDNILNIDGFNIVVGNTIVFGIDTLAYEFTTDVINKGSVGVVTSVEYVSASDQKFRVQIIKTLTDGELLRILNGSTFGNTILKWNQSNSVINMIDRTLYRATVLKNTDTTTLITPWKVLGNNMKLEFSNKIYHFNADDPNTETDESNSEAIAYNKWLTIKNYNKDIYCIQHDPISITEVSAPYITAKTPLESYPDPWNYNLQSYYRISDENPFYSYETPYVKLYKNGFAYSDLVFGGTLRYYGVYDQSELQIYGVSDTSLGLDNIAYLVSTFENQTQTTGHAAEFKAEYVYYGSSSWENFSWFLYDDEDNLLQQSEKQYDRLIEIYLYGLANDTEETKIYYLILQLENDKGNVYEYIIPIMVAPPEANNSGVKLTVTPDCSTCSNILTVSGLNATGSSEDITSYSIFRREYDVYKRPEPSIEGYIHDNQFYLDNNYSHPVIPNTNTLYIDLNSDHRCYKYDGNLENPFYLVPFSKIFKGKWEPVFIQKQVGVEPVEYYRDFGIENQKTYQYILYINDQDAFLYGDDNKQQMFGNYDELVWHPVDENQGYFEEGDQNTALYTGAPVTSNWDYWTIMELVPEFSENLDRTIPVNGIYKVNNDNIWLFKYDLDTGTQTQNIVRDEFQTLSKYSQFSLGNSNSFSGEVAAYLGSEIVPLSKTRYIERLGKSRVVPLSTNEKAHMLKKWHDFVYSKNPKLLKDIKGQSWIVHITSGSNSVQNWITSQPDKISFQWKQIGENKNLIIYGDYDPDGLQGEIKESYGSTPWVSSYGSRFNTGR